VHAHLGHPLSLHLRSSTLSAHQDVIKRSSRGHQEVIKRSSRGQPLSLHHRRGPLDRMSDCTDCLLRYVGGFTRGRPGIGFECTDHEILLLPHVPAKSEHTAIKRGHQGSIKGPSRGHRSSRGHQGSIRRSSRGHQGSIKRSSRGHKEVIQRSSRGNQEGPSTSGKRRVQAYGQNLMSICSAWLEL
jgi:hypothetical protein